MKESTRYLIAFVLIAFVVLMAMFSSGCAGDGRVAPTVPPQGDPSAPPCYGRASVLRHARLHTQGIISFITMAKANSTSSATTSASNSGNGRILIKAMSKRYGITKLKAGQLIVKFLRREKEQQFRQGWWVDLLDAQFQTHIGPYTRIRFGRESHLAHLVTGTLCHDCGCAVGEYHVFGCDAEECSNCGGQAFCCDCGDTEEQSDQLK